MSSVSKKIIVGITGASGSIYGLKLIERLIKEESVSEIALIFTDTGQQVWQYELGIAIPEHKKVKVYQNSDLFSPPASGSALYDSMIIAPCSMGSIGKMAQGISSNLLLRAADVMIKEKRPLLVVFREAPLSQIHLKNLLSLNESGVWTIPASPFFYHHPKNMNELLDVFTSRLLQWLGISKSDFQWGDSMDKK